MILEMLVLATTTLGVGVAIALLLYDEQETYPALTKLASILMQVALTYIVAVLILTAWGVTL